MKEQNSLGVVLIVEDDLPSVRMLNDILEDEGYTVLIAMDGEQALYIANKMQVDIILMDALMPKIDGFKTCEMIKKNVELEHIPVLFMTGLSDTGSVVKGFDAGGVDYINKPIKVNELLVRLKKHLSNSHLTLSARLALDEVGQSSITCDINGKVIWHTNNAIGMLNSASPNEQWISERLPHIIKNWIIHEPERNGTLELRELSGSIQLRFISRTHPGEYLFRLINHDEIYAKQRLMKQFSLTVREADVLLWVAHGKTNREIGLIIDMSPRTVNKHLEQIFKKLDVENRTSAAAVSMPYTHNI
ncbi:DNA-binding response regulator [Psychromonas sp.]|uniref:DNA-binding response regulator n=1 Tax=Psychromonas sp. TaxID=1884585 RepID=UPI003A9810F7